MAAAAAGLSVCAAPVNTGSGETETTVPKVCGNPPDCWRTRVTVACDATEVFAFRADKVHVVDWGTAEVCICVLEGEEAMIETDSDATKAGAAVDWMIDGGGSGVLLGVVAEDSFDHRVTEYGPPLWIEDNACTGDTVAVWTDVP